MSNYELYYKVYTNKSTLVMPEKHTISYSNTFRNGYTYTHTLIHAIEGTKAHTHLYKDVQIYSNAEVAEGYVEVYADECSSTTKIEPLLRDLSQLAIDGVLEVIVYPENATKCTVRYVVKPGEVLKFQNKCNDWKLVESYNA